MGLSLFGTLIVISILWQVMHTSSKCARAVEAMCLAYTSHIQIVACIPCNF